MTNDMETGPMTDPKTDGVRLLACPFCDASIDPPFENIRDAEDRDDTEDDFVKCHTIKHDCGTTGDAIWIEGKDSADCVRKWNTRAAPARCDAEIVQCLRRLTAKLQEVHVHPRFRSVWQFAHMRLGAYDGPTYTEELDAAEAALSALSPSSNGKPATENEG